MSSLPLFRGDGWSLRLATPEDNDALCALVRRIPMEGAVDLTQERDPDFFAFAAMHLGVAETFVACLEGTGEIVGCATCVVRDAWFPDGGRHPVGYVLDIRVLPEHRAGRIFPQLARTGFEYMTDVHGVEITYAAVIDSNRRSTGVATSTSSRRTAQPVSRPMTRYHMVSILFTGSKPPPSARVERGTAADVDDLVEFLARRQAQRTLGYVFDRRLLEARFSRWPGFSPESFHLVRDARGRIVACAAPWDTSALRRLRVVRHRGWMRAFRTVYNAQARWRGAVPLPGAGDCFRFVCLSHLEVEDDDPVLLADLLRSVYRDLQDRGLHFVSAMVPRGSRLEQAFGGFFVNRVAMTLYTSCLANGRWSGTNLATSRPGFEMALA